MQPLPARFRPLYSILPRRSRHELGATGRCRRALRGPHMEHLTESQVKRLLDAMEQREVELRDQVSGERERAMEMYTQLEGVAGDEADQALTKIRAGIENELIDRHVRELAALEAARGRVGEGAVGARVGGGGP